MDQIKVARQVYNNQQGSNICQHQNCKSFACVGVSTRPLGAKPRADQHKPKLHVSRAQLVPPAWCCHQLTTLADHRRPRSSCLKLKHEAEPQLGCKCTLSVAGPNCRIKSQPRVTTTKSPLQNKHLVALLYAPVHTAQYPVLLSPPFENNPRYTTHKIVKQWLFVVQPNPSPRGTPRIHLRGIGLKTPPDAVYRNWIPQQQLRLPMLARVWSRRPTTPALKQYV